MKQPKPWYRKSKNAWYVEIGDTQHRLGTHPAGATVPQKSKRTGQWNPPPEILEAFYGKMAELQAQPCPGPAPSILTVAVLCDRFLDHSHRHNDPKTYDWYKGYLDDFCNHRDPDAGVLGRLPAPDLRPFHVSRWLDAHEGWKTGRGCAIRAVKRAFCWADGEGILTPNPIRKLPREAVPSRGRTLTKDQRKEILDAIRDRPFRLFVEAMQESGCRPSEVARVTAADVNLELGVWVLRKHKTAGKTRKPRTIYLTPRLLEITKELMAKYPDGPLFRGPRGDRPFTKRGICSRFWRLRQKLPHLKDAIAYAYRASFTTDALVNGVGVAQVAELLGHTSTDMVMKHYSHIRQQTEYMREVAKKATGS
jgi:integrase